MGVVARPAADLGNLLFLDVADRTGIVPRVIQQGGHSLRPPPTRESAQRIRGRGGSKRSKAPESQSGIGLGKVELVAAKRIF